VDKGLDVSDRVEVCDWEFTGDPDIEYTSELVTEYEIQED